MRRWSFRNALLIVLFGMTLVVPAWARTPQMQEVAVAQLPVEAVRTLTLIKRGGPFPYQRDGIVFRNREGRLPPRQSGYYREYTVPTPGAQDRGARRIIAGADAEYFYTEDHYRSFRRIRE